MPIPIAIGIPTYNQSAFISRTVESCRQQTYTPLSIVVADDRSADATGEVLNVYKDDARVIYHRNPINAGRIGNYRKLLYEYAKDADWYVNLDGDDYLTDKEFISYAARLVQEQPGSPVVFFQGNHKLDVLKKVFPDAEPLDECSYLIDGKDYFLRFYRVRKFTHLATMYKASAARRIGFYSYDCLSSDFHSLCRLSLTGKVILSARNVGSWQEHESNESKSLNDETVKKELGSLDDIATFARGYLDEVAINRWLKKMRHYYYQRLFYQMSKEKVTISYLFFTLRHFQFNYFYFTCVGRIVLKLCKVSV